MSSILLRWENSSILCHLPFHHKKPAVCLANLASVNCTFGQAFHAVMQLCNANDKVLAPTDKKTEPCRGFVAGCCKFGDKCKHLHNGPSPATGTTQLPPTKHAASDTAHPRESSGIYHYCPRRDTRSTNRQTNWGQSYWLLTQADDSTERPDSR